jgi:hypothetical protein
MTLCHLIPNMTNRGRPFAARKLRRSAEADSPAFLPTQREPGRFEQQLRATGNRASRKSRSRPRGVLQRSHTPRGVIPPLRARYCAHNKLRHRMVHPWANCPQRCKRSRVSPALAVRSALHGGLADCHIHDGRMSSIVFRKSATMAGGNPEMPHFGVWDLPHSATFGGCLFAGQAAHHANR